MLEKKSFVCRSTKHHLTLLANQQLEGSVYSQVLLSVLCLLFAFGGGAMKGGRVSFD